MKKKRNAISLVFLSRVRDKGKRRQIKGKQRWAVLENETVEKEEERKRGWSRGGQCF